MRQQSAAVTYLRALGVLIAFSTPCVAEEAVNPTPHFAGKTDDGYLLPNGWTLTPVGQQVTLTDMPLSIMPLADSRHALVASSGYNQHELCLVDLVERKIVDSEHVRQSWYGLAANAAQDQVWWSGGGADILHAYAIKSNDLSRTSADEPDESKQSREQRRADRRFRSGVALSVDGQKLYSLDINSGSLREIDLSGKAEDRVSKIGNRPYDVVMARNGSRLYVSDWADRKLLAIDPADLRVVARIGTGEHPNQLALHPQDDRLFVSCASSNCVSVVDTRRGVVTETIMTTLFPKAPEGSTPDAVAVSPDGETLFVANADNNCIVVVDIEEPNESQVKGMIPTGWYPTAVAITPDGKNLLVGVGKGNQTKPNPIPAQLAPQDKDQIERRSLPYPYIGTTLSGALSIVPLPDDEELAAYTERVYKNCPYSDKLLAGAASEAKTAIPTKVGDPSPIKHVIYIIKENRTYDQVFGDMAGSNADPSLVMFGEDISPNHHQLAREFVLLDNLYCNGQVSRDGHPWSTMAYNTDYVARDWTLTYSGREGVEDDDDGDLSNAPSGYIWDACARAGLTYRSYGEYGRRVSQPDGSVRVEGAVPGLTGHMCPDYGVPKAVGQRSRDTDNVETFLREFREFEQQGNLPNFIVMSLGEDHTSGTTPGAFTPQACVASNDLALGQLVEAVTQSKFWPTTAIFVIEDDAQNGPDHVDAHRTIGLVISPYTKRKHLDSTQYTTVSMLRSIELILGLPPLSQYDAAANPMYGSFTDKPNPTSYKHLPARYDLNAKNTALSYGAERSSKMDFSEYDRVNDFELNEVLWYAVKGENAPLPPAVRRAIAYRGPGTR
ncbi:MAG TPA: alkaline phosphatase family protein [Pirellulales bacterium]|jgi:YVTN family beta-propeller protein